MTPGAARLPASVTPKWQTKQSVTPRVRKHRATMIVLVVSGTAHRVPAIELDTLLRNGTRMDSITKLNRHADARVSIHPTAIVERGAELGPGVQIGPFCTVGPNVVIEAGAKLVSHVVVEGHTRIGEQAQLFPFCTVGLAPQDFKYKGEPTCCEIGARTLVREHCTIHRGTATGI